jgi:sialic acid synthase SpsE
MFNETFKIADRELGWGRTPYVIAEAGSNFNQSFDTAKRLIDVATEAGADAVKFQLFKASALYPDGGEMYEAFRAVELDAEWVAPLKKHCEDRGLTFLASVFDPGSLDLLIEVGISAIKVASSEATNFSLLERAARSKLPIVLSTGMCDLVDVSNAVRTCEEAGNLDVTLMQCGSVYPLPPEQVNLRVMEVFRVAFGGPVGFSDHTLGHAASLAAVARGAAVVEKHFTLDKKAKGPDHFYALEPAELKKFVDGLREVHLALGGTEKSLLPDERKYGRREGLFAKEDLKAGVVLTEMLVELKRPALGIRARDRDRAVGASVRKCVKRGEPVLWEHLTLN